MHDPPNSGSMSEYTSRYDIKKTVSIYDARPKKAAYGNKFMGKGFESSANYKNCEIYFMNIENAPTMNSAYKKISNAIIK